MTDFEKAVLDVVKNGPKLRDAIFKEICPKIMSYRKLQKTLNELESSGRVVCVSKREEGSRRHRTWYALPEHKGLLEADYVRISEAVRRLRLLLLRNPTVGEVALDLGIQPTDLQEHLYKTAAQTEWSPPTEDIIEDARKKLGEALILAARMRQSPSKDWISLYEGEMEVVEHARVCLSKHQDMLPELTEDGEGIVSWPEKAKRYLGPSYQPKTRIKGVFMAIRTKK